MEIWICKDCLKANLDRTRIFVQEVKTCKSPLDPNAKEFSYEDYEKYLDQKYKDRLLAFKEDQKVSKGDQRE